MRHPKIDREFQRMSIPANDDSLKESILQDGCKEPLLVWNGILVDGYKRLAICKEFKIKYETKKLSDMQRDDVIRMIADERMELAPRGSFACKYLSGKILHDELRGNPDAIERVAIYSKICQRRSISPDTLQTYGKFVEFIDRIDQVYPQYIDFLRLGKLELSRDRLRKLSKLSDVELHWAIQDMMRAVDPDSVIHRPHKKAGRGKSETQPVAEEPISIEMGVKNTPEYDPDTDVRSLTFTVSMWVSTLAKGVERISVEQASDSAKGNLVTALGQLKNQISDSIGVIKP